MTFFLFFALVVLHEPVLVLQDEAGFADGQVSLSRHLEVLPDPLGELHFERVQQATFQKSERFDDHAHVSTFWVRFHLRNEGDLDLHWFLMASNWHYVDLWYSVPDGSFTHLRGGRLFADLERDSTLRYRDMDTELFSLPLRRDVITTCYLRVHSRDAGWNSDLNFELLSAEAVLEGNRSFRFGHGLSIGMIMALAFFHILLFFFVSDRSYIYFGLCCLSVSFYLIRLYGFGAEYVWPSTWDDKIFRLISVVMWGSLYGFTVNFLSARRYTPTMAKAFRWVVILYVAANLLGDFYSLSLYVLLTSYIQAIGIVLCMAMGVVCYLRGCIEAKAFMFGTMLSNGAAVILVLGFAGIIPLYSWSHTLFEVCLCIGMILFGYGLAERIVLLRKEKALAQEQALQSLRRADKLKDEFLANTSHELRTPLNGIIGITESLVDGVAGPLNEKAIANLKMVIAGGKRLASLVNDILDFSQLKHKDLHLRKSNLDIHALASIVLQMNVPLIKGKELVLENHIPKVLPAVLGDENRIHQVFYNLIGNAIKFTESGFVRLEGELCDDDKMVKVSVIDSGIGISKENQSLIFESFEQADGETARHYGGTGLGLTVSQQLVTLHGGEIGVQSTLGEGATFWFTLPVAKADGSCAALFSPEIAVVHDAHVADELPDLEEPIEVEGAFRILIVDDEPMNLQVLLNHLSLDCYSIRMARDGYEAMSILEKEERFDLVLLDIMMPGMSGFEVCRKLRESGYSAHELPVIYLSARNQVSDLVTGFSTGANDYLTKPISKNELLARVRTHLKLLDTNRNLEKLVSDRTKELNDANLILDSRNRELKDKNDALLRTRDQLVMQEKQASLGVITAGISHELRNPLNFVKNFAQLSKDTLSEIQEELNESAEELSNVRAKVLQELLEDMLDQQERIERNADRANDIVTQMVALSLDERGSSLACNLNKFLDEYTEATIYGRSWDDWQLEIVRDYDAEMKPIVLVTGNMARVVSSLVNNAIEAMLAAKVAEPKLKISTKDHGDKVVFSIEDNGDGIPEEQLSAVFTPFFTLRPPNSGHIGLGLSISYDIITFEHHGQIEIVSDIGTFTKVTITLPREKENP